MRWLRRWDEEKAGDSWYVLTHRLSPVALGPVSQALSIGWASSEVLWTGLDLSQGPGGRYGEPTAGTSAPFLAQQDEKSRTQASDSKPPFTPGTPIPLLEKAHQSPPCPG